MISVEQFIKDLKHLALNRKTYYDNSYPSNCGEINGDGSISFDCIGLVKSYINEPSIAYKTAPAGYFVRPGQVIPDTTEYGILELCSNINWGNFGNCIPGSYLYMSGHAGVFVGEFEDTTMGGIVNTIECTTAWYGGVLTSYTDVYGNRFQYKGGPQCYKWEAWGQLTKYIDYSKPQPTPPQPTPTVDAISLAIEIYQGKWGNNPEREKDITAKFGADMYRKAQDRVNFICETISNENLFAKLADEILNDKWGNNPEREQNITAKFGAKFYRGAQDIVNDVCNNKITMEDVNTSVKVADEILLGKWGNNPERKENIIAKFGENVYTRAQGIVNKSLA